MHAGQSNLPVCHFISIRGLALAIFVRTESVHEAQSHQKTISRKAK